MAKTATRWKAGTWSESARRVLAERYLWRKDGKLIEDEDGLVRRVARAIARAEANFPHTGRAVEEVAQAFYDIMIERKFLPNSPTLMNAGKDNGQQLSACFVLPVEDSMEGIFDAVKWAAIVHQSGGGTGFAFSRLRPAGAIVRSTQGVASGPVSFMKVFNEATERVKQGGCVVPDTRVTTNRGIVPIRELGPAGAPADSWHRHAAPLIVATDDGPRASDEFYNHGAAPVRRIRTRSGYALAATLEHRIRVIDDEGRYVWRLLKDLKPGDWAVLQKGHLLEPDDYGLPPLDAAAHQNATAVRLPTEASAQLGEFIGYVIGDGRFNRYNRGGTTGRLILTVCDEQPEVAAWLLRTSRELFGIAPVVTRNEPDGSTNYSLNATTLVDWLHQLGVEKASADTARVPEIVFRKGAAMARGFLRGLFTADGTVSQDGYPSLSSASGALIEGVQQLLLAVGVPSRVSVTRNRAGAFGDRPLHRLCVVTRAGLEVFAETIGFLDTGRNSRLARDGRAWEFNDVIPHQARALKAVYAGPGRGSGPGRGPRGADRALYRDIQHYLPAVAAPRNLTRLRLTALADRHEAIRNSLLNWFVTDDQFYDPIETIEEGESLTLDLSVPANNTYIANGFVSHNTRRGANMGILRVDHPDILEFIDCKLDGGVTNFNISVAATDRFMQALAEDGEYELIAPHTKEVVGRLRARAVMDRIVKAAWATGDPGMVFIDRINAGPANPTPTVGEVEATNPCGEQPLLPFEACNLGSLNLAQFVKGRDLDWDELERVIRLCVRFLDDVIEVNPYPLEQIHRMVKANRRIGLGVMGWADLLFLLGIPYDSQEALALAERVMGFINRIAHDESAALAEERGPFPNWSVSIYRDDRPLRNSTVTTIAPTGTISIIADCSSGIEPIFALAFVHKVGERTLRFVNPVFERVAKERGFWSEALMQKVMERGSVHDLPEVPEDVRRVFVTAHEITPEWHVRMQAAFQKHTDNAVSKTINLPNHASVEDVRAAYQLAYDLGCLGITVFRDGCKGEQVLNVGVREKAEKQAEAAPAATPALPARVKPRPALVQGYTRRMEAPEGKVYVTLNKDDDGLFEVFINVGKAGSDIAALADAVGRLISLNLRLPSTMTQEQRQREIITHLKGIGGSRSIGFGPNQVRSLPDAVAQALALDLGEAPNGNGNGHANGKGPADGNGGGAAMLASLSVTGNLCPDCGCNTLTYEEGCKKCHVCGFSEC